MDFEPYFKVHSLVSAHPKSTLCQMTNLNMIPHEVVSVYLFVRIWNSPQFPAEFISERFRNGQYVQTETDTGLLRRGKGVCDTVRPKAFPRSGSEGIFLRNFFKIGRTELRFPAFRGQVILSRRFIF